MQLAILHYHLNRGGVTQVILNHLLSLAACSANARPERVAVLHCGRHDGWPAPDAEGNSWHDGLPFPCQLIAVPALEYDAKIGVDEEALAGSISHGLVEGGLELSQTVLHVHNHALGKNASLPGALVRLAEQGCRLLLQVHDFAEDFRPTNYRHLLKSLRMQSPQELAGVLYPQSLGIHYATLTARDQALLTEAGVAQERLHVLPNPVVEFKDLPDADQARDRVRDKLHLDGESRLIVYPVRGIRRKNLGEMLLLSALAGSKTCFAVTLAPKNPAELASFCRWQDLAERLDLNCRFDIGGTGGVKFVDALAAADAIVTTSVAEGFGMVFLEASLAGSPLVGRNLPEITADFVATGLEYPGLRDELRVPIAWLDEQMLREQLLELHLWACHDYNIDPPEETDAQLDGLLAEGAIDFARLPYLCQVDAISHVVRHLDSAREAIALCNDGFDGQFRIEDAPTAQVAANAKLVRKAYSPQAVGERLASVYSTVMQDDPPQTVHPIAGGESILASFLRLDRLNPIRVEA